MNGQKRGFLAPALIGGAMAGILSGIPFLNCLCCLWIIGGAVLASALLSKNSTVVLTSGDGAIVGAFTGLVATAVLVLISIPFQAVNAIVFQKFIDRMAEYSPDFQTKWNAWLGPQEAGPLSIVWFLVFFVATAAVFAALGTLGGIIGIALFGKKTPPSSGAPPQPPLPFPPPQT
jgi:hypothetical protein